MKNRTALITGVSGQDGSYLAELLTAKGYRVIGASRNPAAAATALSKVNAKVDFVEWDMSRQELMEDIFSTYKPCEIYNFGAYSSGSGMYSGPVAIGDINGLAVARILDAIQRVDPTIRFCQASSSEMFGEPAESPQSEQTAFSPRSPYGAAKLYAHSMVAIYRKHHGLFAASAILFNHESPRRGTGFVTRKITREAAKIKLGISAELRLGNLLASRDWGFAGDYVRAMWLMMQQAIPTDYVLATGRRHTVREFCAFAFFHLGLDYRDFVHEDREFFRPVEAIDLVGNPEKAASSLGWRADTRLETVVQMMVDSDLALLMHERDGGHWSDRALPR